MDYINITGNLSDEKMTEIREALDRKGARNICQRCDNDDFVLLDSFAGITALGEGMTRQGLAMPVAAMICSNCGYAVFHALERLGVAP